MITGYVVLVTKNYIKTMRIISRHSTFDMNLGKSIFGTN